MDLRAWYKKRGARFIYLRGKRLVTRYGLTQGKVKNGIKKFVAALAEVNCSPTFFTPGSLLMENPEFFIDLQRKGVELGVHGYYHINLTNIPVDKANQQLMKAIQTFNNYGLDIHGFRCPYLGCNDQIINTFTGKEFIYSSNSPIVWNGNLDIGGKNKNLLFNTISKFYTGEYSTETVSYPYMKSNLVEIPLFVPDDLQLHDGLELNEDEAAKAWILMFKHIYNRGELFVVMFHTEQAKFCTKPFLDLIKYAQMCQPGVWIARLCDISEWFIEKSKFTVETSQVSSGLRLTFGCSPRATILIKGAEISEHYAPWDGAYQRVVANSIEIPAGSLPFIGIGTDVPDAVVTFLSDQGYILINGEEATSCNIYLDNQSLAHIPNDAALIDFIEGTETLLVRYWRWPDGVKSAISITGDLDALSLVDYMSRLFIA